MSIEWISHKGKKILYIDYSKMSLEEELEQIEKATRILVETKDKNNRTLSDMRNANIDQSFLDLSKEKGKISRQFTRKAAVLGVEGVRLVLLKMVNAFSGNARVPFPTMEQAKDWLVQD
jgi:hypothetical protein